MMLGFEGERLGGFTHCMAAAPPFTEAGALPTADFSLSRSGITGAL